MVDSLGMKLCCELNARLPRFRSLWLWLWNLALRHALRYWGASTLVRSEAPVSIGGGFFVLTVTRFVAFCGRSCGVIAANVLAHHGKDHQ